MLYYVVSTQRVEVEGGAVLSGRICDHCCVEERNRDGFILIHSYFHEIRCQQFGSPLL